MRRQYYGSPLEAQDWFIDDFEEQWDLLETEIVTRQSDLFTKGVVGDPTITIGSSTELTLPAFNFYLDGELIEVSAGDITIDTSVDNTFKVFADYTEDIVDRTETRERRIVDQKHKRISYTPDYSISTSADATKVQICEIVISGSAITSVDNTERDYIKPDLGNYTLDDIPDGTTYKKLEAAEADWLNNTVGGDAHKVMMKNASGVTEHDFVDDNNIKTGYNLLTDDELYEAGMSDKYGEEITIKPEFGELYIDTGIGSDFSYVNPNTSNNILHGGATYGLRSSSAVSTGTKLIEIQDIPARPYESFEVELDMFTSDTSNEIYIQIDAIDKDGNTVSTTSNYATCSATSTVERKILNKKISVSEIGSLIADQDDACKVNISVVVGTYVINSKLIFTPPIIRRKSKNAKIYEVEVESSWSSPTLSWGIIENTDNVLSGVARGSDYRIDLTFDSSIIELSDYDIYFVTKYGDINGILGTDTGSFTFPPDGDPGGVTAEIVTGCRFNNSGNTLGCYILGASDTNISGFLDYSANDSRCNGNRIKIILKRKKEL